MFNGIKIYNKDPVINFEIPSHYLIKKFILKPEEGSLLTPTKKNNKNGLKMKRDIFEKFSKNSGKWFILLLTYQL